MPASWPSALAFIVLLTLAGCSGLSLEGTTTPERSELTPAPVPDAVDGSGPPGIADGEVTSVRLLGQAHGAALNELSYTVASNRTVVYPNETVRSQIRTRVAVERDGTHLADVSVRGPRAPVLLGRPPASATFWSDGERNLRRLERDNRTVYNEYTPPDSYAGTRSFWVQSVALDGTPTRDVTRTLGSFRTLTVAERAGASNESLIRGRALWEDESVTSGAVDPTNATLTARVRNDGLVAAYRVRYTARTPDGERIRVIQSVRFENVGQTTVERPSWYDRAVELTNETSTAAGPQR